MADSTMSSVEWASQELASLVFEEEYYLPEVHHCKIEKLQLDLEWCRFFLLDAETEEKKPNSPLVRKWVSQISGFASEAREIIDEYVLVVHRIRQEGFWNGIRKVSCACCDKKALSHVGSRIDALSHRISELVSKMKFSGEVQVMGSNWIMMPNHIDILEKKSGIVDFEDSKTVISKLFTDEHRLIILHGKRGSGKTTMARMLYDNDDVRRHFVGFLWITVSKLQLGAREILEMIWLDLCGNVSGPEPKKRIKEFQDVELRQTIYVALRARKLLLVLDDIPSEQSWFRLQSGLPLHHNCKLIVITSSDEVKRQVTNYDAYSHQPKLTEKAELLLLEQIASQGGRKNIDDLMESWGGRMIKQCEHNALAIVLVGGTLAFKNTEDEWQQVHDSIAKSMEIKKDSVLHDVMEVCYLELPPYIRPCFLHFGNLPKGLEIPANKLCRMWVAEGLVRSPPPPPPSSSSSSNQADHQNLEKVAEIYLNELVKRCLVEVVSRGKNGKVKSCRMHDSLKIMCAKRGTEVNCVRVTSTEIKENAKRKTETETQKLTKKDTKETAGGDAKKSSKTDIKKIGGGDAKSNATKASNLAILLNAHRLHGLALHVLDRDRESKSLPDAVIKSCDQLKSLLFIPLDGKLPWRWLKSIKASPLLRVLHLENARISALPAEIGNLVHLKYLSLRGSRVEQEIPSSIGDLSVLETLDLRAYGTYVLILGTIAFSAGSGNGSILLPNVFWKLKKLRHLFLPESYLCKLWRKLHLYTLTNLETLKNLDLRRCRVKGLLKLEGLKKITYSGNDMFESQDKKILKNLLDCPSVKSGHLKNKLTLKVSGELLSNTKYAGKLTGQEGYRKSVDGLIIWGPLTSSLRSNTFKDLVGHLKCLVLRFTDLEDDPMQILDSLPNLERLRLSYGSYTGTTITFLAKSFPQLAYLKLDMLPKLQNWNVDSEAMLKLEILEIEYCDNLKEVPDPLAQRVKVRRLTRCIPRKNQGTSPCEQEPQQDNAGDHHPSSSDPEAAGTSQPSSSAQTPQQ